MRVLGEIRILLPVLLSGICVASVSNKHLPYQEAASFISHGIQQSCGQYKRTTLENASPLEPENSITSNDYLSAVFTFQVAQKLRQGRPLLDAGVPSANMQESAHSHFLGYLGQVYEDEIKPRLDHTVEEYLLSSISLDECAKRILREFMFPLINNFTKVDVMEPAIALDRELQVLYSADLAASYIILFCPLRARKELYRHIWGNGAFLDGNINWLCCPWVLNQAKHDEGYHQVALDIEQLSNEEIIDIIRLHKNYLSTDYVKQRSRKALKQLDRRSLLSVFQSVMLRVLWGREAVSETQNTSPQGDTTPPGEDLPILQDESKDAQKKKEEIRMNTLSGWLEEYRNRRGYSTLERIPAPKNLQLKETEYVKQMRRSIDVITKNLEYFNEVFKRVPDDTPFVEAAMMKSVDGIPDMSNISDDVTLGKIRNAFKTLLKIYQDNLANNSELYGFIPNSKGLKLLKFLLSYEKHELIRILSAVLLALPEFMPIANEQGFAQYAMVPFNTLAKLCFIAIMRINPDIATMDLGVELDDADIISKKSTDINGSLKGPGRFNKDMKGNPSMENLEYESDSDQEENANETEDDISSMIFTNDELVEISQYVKWNKCKVAEAQVGNQRKKCILLDSCRTRPITEAIMMHLSSYEAVYDVLNEADVEPPEKEKDGVTMEAIRKHRLAAVLKRMTEAELNSLYVKVIQSSKMHEELKVPEEICKMTHHCLLDNIDGELQDEQLYTKLMEVLTRIDEDEQGADLVISETTSEDNMNNEYNPQEGTGCEIDEPGEQGYNGSNATRKRKIVTAREHYLNLIEGEDISSLVNNTFSSNDPKEMTEEELRKIADELVQRMESSEGTKVIHYNPVASGARPFHLHAMPGNHSSSRYMVKNYPRPYAHGFSLQATPYDAFPEYMAGKHVNVAEMDEASDYPEHGIGIFPKRREEKLQFSWQFPETMKPCPLVRNRVTLDGLEKYTTSWRELGLKRDVADAAVAWIRKSLLDSIGSTEDRNLEIEPTEIQKMAIQNMLKGTGDFLIASNAASGKTLAYMLPLIQKLKEQEKLKLRYPNSPRALILTPSRELADQTLYVLKGLGHIAKLSSESVCGGFNKGKQRDHMKRLVDVVVATPDRLLKMIKHVKLHMLQYLVLDEADTLLNEGFWPDISKILDVIKHPYSLIQVAPSSKYLLHFEKVQKALAKVPNMKGTPNKIPEINAKYLNRIVNCRKLVETAWVDRPNRGASHEFRYLKGEDKALELVNLLRYDDPRRYKKVIVFCNSVQSCRAVEHILRESNLPATSLHGKIPIKTRRKYYEDFINLSTGILVCSDLASRGLDFNADAVIMFDFPLNSMDYLKRCGRVGRMVNNDRIAPRGYAISLVKKRDRNLAIAIERSIRMPFFPISPLTRNKEDYNQRSGRLKYLTQSGGYFKLAKLLRQAEIKGTYNYSNMDHYLEQFKDKVKEMYQNSLKKIVLRRRKICKRRRILTRRLKLMKRYNRAIRLKQRIISQMDRNRRLKRFTIHAPMKGEDRSCPQMKDLRPIRAKILELKLMEDKMTRRLLERNDRNLRKFINKTQLVARSLAKPEVAKDSTLDLNLPLQIIERAKEKIRHKVKRICSLL